jgi:ribosomal-protein-alanine N-acetyltransferase
MSHVMSNLEIREFNINDIEELYEVELTSFTDPWSKESFKDELNNEIAHYLVGSINNKVVAYIGAWFILDEAHITNVAVKSDFRRQKIAKQLITAFIVLAKKHQITSITLEVRASNIPAQSLYQQFGFEKQGLRKRYYADNNEDAIIMWLRNI